MKFSLKINIIILLVLLILVILFGIINGAVNIPFKELLNAENKNILHLRMIRILVAVIVGCGLAVSGIAMQSILRNPLAEPYLLGTSAGAGLGAVIAIIIGGGRIYLPIAAFCGGILAIILVYNLARVGSKVPVQSLILSGAIISIAISGILVFLISISDNEALHGAMWWLWGNMMVYDLKLLYVVSGIVIAGIIAIYAFWQDLNAISIGEEDAIHLGIDIETVKKILFFTTALITASIVSIAGIIGFVGLIIPHMVRNIVGQNHRVLIPAACLVASIFMIICDIVSRTIFSPMEIPIGVITAILGTPVFIIILKSKQKIR